MSTWRERVPETTGFQLAYDWLDTYYHVVVVALLMVFGLWLRTVGWENFRVGDTVLFTGNDPFYHLRSVQYVVANWPATMPFEPWTNFPIGTSPSQFGTLFDQLVATVALVVGLGSPSDELVRLTLLFAPAVLGVLLFVPAYVIGRRLGGRFGGVMAVAVMAFANGRLFTRSFVGFSDHHVAEALFQAIAVLGLMVAITVVEREKPVYELLAERAFGTMRHTLGWSVLAGVGVALYLFIWPPGVLLLGILGIFFVLYLSVEFLRGRSPEHVAIAGAVSMATTGVLVLSTVNTFAIQATARSLLQPLLAFGIAGGCLFMAWLARAFDDRDLPGLAYPGIVVGIGLGLAGLLAVLAPSTFGYLQNNVLRVVGLGLGTTAESATVGEVSPMPFGNLIDYYAFAAVAAAGGATLVVYRQFVADEPRGEELLVLVWMAFVLVASLTQIRFAYYLTVPVAALTGMVSGWTVRYATSVGSGDGVETYQVLTIVVLVMLVIAPLAGLPGIERDTVVDASTPKGTGPDVQGWHESLSWMQDNTPVPGRYGEPDGEPMAYLGTYNRTDDYDYPPGAYGVISWWDYGHWITAMGERIPNANPFQQGANHAADYLLAQNESSAAAELAERDEDDAETRFTMVDWKMAESDISINGKFFAPATFRDGVQPSDYYSYVLPLSEGANQYPLIRHKQSYYDSMVNRLYNYHGSAMEPEPIVVEWQGEETPYPGIDGHSYTGKPTSPNASAVQRFETMEAAREYVADPSTQAQIGGIGPYPSERVPALEHYRLVHESDMSALDSQSYYQSKLQTVVGANLQQVLGDNVTQQGALGWLHQTSPAWTKTFERVPGATIEGSGPANANVTARVQLQPNEGAQFSYTQRTRTDENGEFSMTVPYASTGYDEWGPEEGYTNTSVRATGPYTLFTDLDIENGSASWHEGQVNVTEGQVLGEDDSPATVTLEPTEQSPENQTGSDDGTTVDPEGDSGSDGATGDDGNGTEGGDAGESGNETGTGANDSSPSLAAPATQVSNADASGAVQP